VQYCDSTSFLLNRFDNATPYNIADIGVISVTGVGEILITDSIPSVAAGAVGFLALDYEMFCGHRRCMVILAVISFQCLLRPGFNMTGAAREVLIRRAR
jgi:hypothetical protein